MNKIYTLNVNWYGFIASDLIQKQIEELRAKSKSLYAQASDLENEAKEIDSQIIELEESH